MKIILHWLILSAAIFASAYFIPGISISGIPQALLAAAVLLFINTLIKPIVKILTLPITILTLGLFALILNGLFFWFVAGLIQGFTVTGFMAAFWGALLVSVINWIGNKVLA